jgi:hypothetical protein
MYTVLMPTGKILILGGNKAIPQIQQNEVLEVEEYNPSTNSYSTLKSMPQSRMYHSSTLLVPDGRVLIAGGQVCANAFCESAFITRRENADFFSPPYLFRAAANAWGAANGRINDVEERPNVTSAPPLIATGSNFTVNVSAGFGAGGMSSAALMRPGSVTHSFDHDQRYVPLGMSWASGVATVTAPSSADEVPPGYYMLFFVNNLDATVPGETAKPSIGRFARVWGVLQSSITKSVGQTCSGTTAILNFDVSWNTSLASDNVNDVLEIWPPGAACGSNSPSVKTALPLADRRQHRVTGSVPCSAGTWKFVVKSTLEGTTTKSICENVVVACTTCSQCNPPCELE